MKILKYASVLPYLFLIIVAFNQNFLPTDTKVEYTGEIYKEQAISLIKESEGFRSTPYKDSDGSLKIGYGFPANGMTEITEGQADIILRQEFATREKKVRGKADELNIGLDFQHVYALVSFHYNLGHINVINNLTEKEWKSYVYVNGKKSKGVEKYRFWEWELFNS